MSGQTAPTDLLPGIVGGRYRTVALRGAGAEGAVYLAVDLFTGREVALKLGLPAALAAEYARAASVAHPHLARALALWHGAGTSALAFEYAAVDLTALRGQAEPAVVRHVAEIARALAYLHRRGMVHADVKPQNALLTGSGQARRALLTDLGLAGVAQTSRGSLEYAAPEVLEGSAPLPASDLYSLGVTLHELLGGANPFSAATPAEVIRAHFNPVPSPRASPAIQAVVAKLLARDPRARYADANEVVEALAAASGLELESEGEGLAPDRIGLGELHGRDAELARFERAAALAAGGSGVLVALVGPPRSGRSRLLRAFAAAAELKGLRTLRLEQGQGLSDLCRWLGVLLSDGAPAAPTSELALERLGLASNQHPLCLVIDDADGDGGLRALVSALARDETVVGRPLLVAWVASEAIASAAEQIDVLPLPPGLAKKKLLEALGPRSFADGLAEMLVRESSGSPGELEDAVRDLAERGVLQRRRGRWELDEERAGPDFAGCLPREARRRARERVEAMPGPLRFALGVAAVLGASFEREALLALLSSAEVDQLLAANLLRAEATRLLFPQLALVKAAQLVLPSAELRQANLKAAELATDVAERAHHLFRARARGAVRAALAAARARLRAGAPAKAARLYQLASAALRAPFANARAALLGERAADCLAVAGKPAQARCQYALALARGGHPGRLWQKIAKAFWQEGRMDEVLAAAARSRAGNGEPVAVATIEARAHAMRGDYQRAEELAARALPLARERGDAEAAGRLHHLLGTCAWHRGEGRRAVAEERAAVQIARRANDRRAEADARTGLGTAYRLVARYRRSASETARAIELYSALGDERQEGLAWNNLGVTHYLTGNWQGALQAWGKLENKRRTLEEELATLNNLGYLYRERGDLARSRDLLLRALGKIEQSGGYARDEAAIRGNLGEVAAREGDGAAAEAHYQKALEIAQRIDARDEVVETERRLAQLDLLRRNPAGANARAVAALELAVRSGNRVEQGNLLGIVALAARARGDAAAAAQAVRTARAALEKAGALLELARLECIACLLDLDRGDPVEAAAALRRARTVCEQLGAAPDLREIEQLERDIEALQRRSMSQVDALVQAATGLASRSDPAALLEDVLDQALLLTGAERGFILLNEEGGGEPRVAAVRGAGAGAALRISHTVADRVLHTGEVVSVSDIVGREQLSTQKSILDLGLRSVLCVPIRFAGRQLGILYVDSRRVGARLSDKDLGLLSAFAALAGSALDSARMVENLRRKGDLLAHMAHEFRSPLVGIQGYSEFITMNPALDPKVRADVEVINSQAVRLASLISRTLELAQMEAGAARLAHRQVDLQTVAGAAIAGLKPLASIKQIQVSLSVEAGALPVLGDFDRLVQVVTNLVGNAIHYSANGTRVSVRVAGGEPLPPHLAQPRIEIEGAPEVSAPYVPPRERPSTLVVVADQGPGMSQLDLAKLFTPFFRGGGAKSSTGTGLGLVITREIVRAHGGEIRVESKLGQGTAFTVLLPGAV